MILSFVALFGVVAIGKKVRRLSVVLDLTILVFRSAGGSRGEKRQRRHEAEPDEMSDFLPVRIPESGPGIFPSYSLEEDIGN